MELVNLTPHAVRYLQSNGEIKTIQPSGKPARVDFSKAIEASGYEGIKVVNRRKAGKVEGLPDPTPGVCYIVSIVVLHEVGYRPDVLAPATGPDDGAVRFADGPQKGQIDYVTRFIAAI